MEGNPITSYLIKFYHFYPIIINYQQNYKLQIYILAFFFKAAHKTVNRRGIGNNLLLHGNKRRKSFPENISDTSPI